MKEHKDWIARCFSEHEDDEEDGVIIQELIRCKDCKWYDTSKNGVNGFCRNLAIPFDSYEWCSRAERRSEE